MKTKIAIIIAIFLCTAAFAEENINIETTVDRETALVGDHIYLDVKVTGPKGMEVLFPSAPEVLKEFSIISSRELNMDTREDSGRGMEYVISSFENGEVIIPPITIRYKLTPESEWEEDASKQTAVTIGSLLTGSDEDIRDVKGLLDFSANTKRLLMIFGTMIALTILAIVLYKKFKAGDFNRKPGIIKPPHEIAYEELLHLKAMDLPSKGQIKEYYGSLSDIVRHYVENRFAYRAPEMTTEEFLGHVKDVTEIDREPKRLLKNFLTNCDMVKFAKYGPTKLEVLDSYKLAENIVDVTREEEEIAES
jgi:BatD DUF11 like domain